MTATDQLPDEDQLQRRAVELLQAWRVPETDIEVTWNKRLSTTAGRAFVRGGRIELNPRLLANVPDHVDAVLTHEAAHVAVHRLFGENVQAHGRHWRSLMRLAGHEPEVTHRFPLDGIKRRRNNRYLYLRMCGGCGDRAVLSVVRYPRCRQCSRRDAYMVLRARATAAGRRALTRMSEADVRSHFA